RAESGGPPGVPSRREPLSPQQLREWYARRCRRVDGATGPTAGGATGAGAARGAAGAVAAGGASGAAGGAAGAGGTGTVGGPAGVGAAGGAGAAGPGGARIGGTGATGAGGAVGVGAVGAGDVPTRGAAGAGAVGGPRASGAVGVLGLPPPTGPPPPLLSPPLVQSQSQLQPASPLPGPSPYSGPTRGLTEHREPESRRASPESRPESPVRTVCTGRRVPRQRPPPFPGTQSMTLRPSTAPQRVPLPSPPASSLPALADPESESLRTASPTVMRLLATVVTYPSFESTAAFALVVELVDLAAHCRLDYAASLVAEIPPSVGAFLQGSLHEEIWLRRPPGFTGSFPPGTQSSLRRPVYGLRQAPREWHDTLRTTLGALVFAPFTADPSLFLRTDATLLLFYVLVAQHTITLTQSHMVLQVLQRFGFTYSSPQSTPLPTGHSPSAPPSEECVEPSGPYPELVGCLMHRKVHWDAAKRVLRYLCSTSGMGLVLGGRARVVLTGHADASWVDDLATQRSSQGYTFSLGSGSVSWRSTRSSSVLSSICEAEIYAGAMAAQELRWLTYLLTDLGETPRSPPVLYVDNKAMLALCPEHRLEHRTKHIALRYFLARELQQRGQLRLAYVASRANIADVFTKALQPCDHQRFCTVLGLVPIVPQLLTS
ncbi:unnamed protein product, partial [Closterium sp. NIES-54]